MLKTLFLLKKFKLLKKIKNIFNFKAKSYCHVCGKTSVKFNPLPDSYIQTLKKYGFIYLKHCEMTPINTYSCCNCGASDRERLYAKWLFDHIKKGSGTKNNHLLHFSPELSLQNLLESKKFFKTISFDLKSSNTDINGDIENLPFKDSTFDLFICSHVLEHVNDDAKALSELFRVTKKNGVGIIMAPIVSVLDHTIEDSSLNTAELRWKYFGQNDHVRLYSRGDFIKRIKLAGFEVKTLDINYFGKKTFIEMGLKKSTTLYVAKK